MSQDVSPERLGTLDGWRGISILLVLATHLLPLGPKKWHLNEMTGPLGMALFFTLSGFLITTFLLKKPFVISFLLRRVFRIVPLAWMYLLIVLTLQQSDWLTWVGSFFFYGNIPPYWLTPTTGHYWSLCVEVHFYIGVAFLVAVSGRRGLYILPVLALGVTAYRIEMGATINIITWLRIDEILAGAALALIYYHRLVWHGTRQKILAAWIIVLIFALVSCHPLSSWLQYLRPYAVASLIGISILAPLPMWAKSLLESRELAYVAAISFALYVIHPLLANATWLGSGSSLIKYAKRPLLFIFLFALAHGSTFYFEAKCIAFGRQLSTVFERRI